MFFLHSEQSFERALEKRHCRTTINVTVKEQQLRLDREKKLQSSTGILFFSA